MFAHDSMAQMTSSEIPECICCDLELYISLKGIAVQCGFLDIGPPTASRPVIKVLTSAFVVNRY